MSASTGAGLAVAAAAAACYETGYAFQALEARGVGARHALRVSLIGQLVRNVRWLGATALSLLGWPLQVLALSLAPLALVQPTLALGLLLLLFLGARVLGEPVGRRELVAVALVVAGIACLAVAAPDAQHGHRRDRDDHRRGRPSPLWRWRPTRCAGAGPACWPSCRRAPPTAWPRSPRSSWPASWPTRAGASPSPSRRWPRRPARWPPLSEMSALQRLPATRVAPIVLAFQIVVPVVVVAAVGGEDWGATPLGGAVLVVGLVAVVAGAVAAGRLAARVEAHRPAVARISAAALGIRVSERSGSGRWASARRSAASSSARVVATSASPKRR